MKLLNLLVLPLVLFSLKAQATGLNSYKCNEIGNKNSVTQKEVLIQELQDITNQVSYGKHYDSVLKVSVTVSEYRQGLKEKLASFVAAATSVDVLYNISSVKKNGFKLWNYMDEEDQAGFEWTLPNGQKEEHRLHCDIM